ncbi:MAG: SDR family oxidoreductase [Deltaproteobacteria bacterium]|nr:SDR family oxidoreductase [Deltaproteobacteria bacterium]
MTLLEGKRALVTGGSRGLGAAICKRLAKEGASVAFSYNSHGDAAQETLEAVEGLGGTARAFQCSVLEEAATTEMVSELVKAWGGLDILVNNAGITQNLPLPLLELEDFDRVMAVNVRGTYLTSRAVARPMIRSKSGVILNIGSLAGERALEAPIHYCASKAAVSGMTRAMAKELARHHIRVLCLAPGLLEDGVGRNLPEHRRLDYLHHCSLGRAGTFDEVAAFAAFLVSGESSFMSGETVVMDGGV